MNTVKQQTLCWDCANYCYGCSWSEDFIPVEGWQAIPTQGRDSCSFIVLSCPLFNRDSEGYGLRKLGAKSTPKVRRTKHEGQPPTSDQLEYISLIQKQLDVPAFKGKTIKEANEYIDEYRHYIGTTDNEELDWFAR